MKKYTIENFDKFERVGGYIVCPSGDYTAIKDFLNFCSFGERCIFGERCSFGAGCIFGAGCRFGARCIFGKRCIFAAACIFGELCSFGAGCSFAAWCSFGERCSFGAGCRFGERCSFAAWCSFENNRIKNGKYFACDRIGSEKRKTYFFIDETGKMFVRAGCFFGTLTEFIARVKEVHAGTKFEKEYFIACELAKVVLEKNDEII